MSLRLTQGKRSDADQNQSKHKLKHSQTEWRRETGCPEVVNASYYKFLFDQSAALCPIAWIIVRVNYTEALSNVLSSYALH